jgi:hypothetical protein
MKTIRKYFWQFIGPVLALFAIFATYNVFYMGRPTKALQVAVDPPVSLIDIRSEAAKDIEVFYKGRSVSNISLLQINITNSGNQPITESDYSRPVSFSFPPSYDVADVTVTASDPPNIGLVITQTSGYQAEAAPVLLNPDDAVTVRFIVIGASSDSILRDFEIDGRIAGIREIDIVSSSEQPASGLSTAVEAIAVGILGIALTMMSSIFFTERVISRIQAWLLRRLRKLSAHPDAAAELTISAATYGAQDKTNDVTQILASQAKDGKLELLVSNDNLGGDPIPGVVKKLRVKYIYTGKQHSVTVDERETLSLP